MTFNAITLDLQHKLKVGDIVTVEKPGRKWDEEVKPSPQPLSMSSPAGERHH